MSGAKLSRDRFEHQYECHQKVDGLEYVLGKSCSLFMVQAIGRHSVCVSDRILINKKKRKKLLNKVYF